MPTKTPKAPKKSAASLTRPKKVRFYVVLSKRGRRVALTMNGGSFFKDATLAFNGAKAAMKRDGFKRAVIHELWFDSETTWTVAGTATLTAPKAQAA